MANEVVIKVSAENTEMVKKALKELGLDVKNLGTSSNQASEGALTLSKAWKETFGTIITLTGAITFLKSTLQEAMEQEEAILRLNNALQIQGTYTRELSTQYQNLASALQMSSRYSDEAIEGVMERLIAIGNVAPSSIERVTKATLDFASASRKDLGEAGQIIAAASEGITRGLSRFGIVISENIPKSKVFEEVLKQIEDKFGGRAQADVNSFSGKLELMKNMWGELKEEIGMFSKESTNAEGNISTLTGLIIALKDGLKELRENSQKSTEELTGVDKVMRNLAEGSSDVVDKLHKAFGAQSGVGLIKSFLLGDTKGMMDELNMLFGVIPVELEKITVTGKSSADKLNEAFKDMHDKEEERLTKEQEDILLANAKTVEDLRNLWEVYADDVGMKKMEMYFQEQTFLQGIIDLKQKEMELGLLQDEEFGKRLAQYDEDMAKYQFMIDVEQQANSSLWSQAGKLRDTFSSGISKMTMDWIKGNLDIKKAFEQLGQQMLQVLIDWAIQTALNQALSFAMHAAQIAVAKVTGTAIALAYAPAAANVSLATMGGNAAPASAGISATHALTMAMSVPKAEEGGIIPGSPGGTLVLAGEKGKKEAIIPLEGNTKGFGDTYIHVEVHNPIITNDEMAQSWLNKIAESVSDIISKDSER